MSRRPAKRTNGVWEETRGWRGEGSGFYSKATAKHITVLCNLARSLLRCQPLALWLKLSSEAACFFLFFSLYSGPLTEWNNVISVDVNGRTQLAAVTIICCMWACKSTDGPKWMWHLMVKRAPASRMVWFRVTPKWLFSWWIQMWQLGWVTSWRNQRSLKCLQLQLNKVMKRSTDSPSHWLDSSLFHAWWSARKSCQLVMFMSMEGTF